MVSLKRAARNAAMELKIKCICEYITFEVNELNINMFYLNFGFLKFPKFLYMTHVINGGIIHSQRVPLKLRGIVGLYFIFSPRLKDKSPNLQHEIQL